MFQPVAGDFTLAWKQAQIVNMALLASFRIKLSPELDYFCLNPFVVFSAVCSFKEKKVTALQRMEKIPEINFNLATRSTQSMSAMSRDENLQEFLLHLCH